MKHSLFMLVLLFLASQAMSQRLQTSSVAIDAGGLSAEAPEVVIRAIDRDMNTRIAPPQGSLMLNPTATIEVTYIGFPGGAQTAFQYAADIWEGLITSSEVIKVTARWTPLGSGVLGSASAASIWRDFGGAPVAGTWYPQALAEKLTGGSLNHPDSSDIDANFNSTFPNWYFGTDGNTPSGQFDFVTVVLHELGHGLGFFGSMSVAGGTGSWGFGTGFPTIYDRFAENGSNQQLINTSIFPNPSMALGTQLISNNIFFDGTNATPANGGTPPKLYCPASWTSGSSFSHLDETTYPAGNPHSLMTPMVGTAEAIHSPGTVSLAMFEDWGWTTTPPPPSNIKWEERFSGTTIPPGWRVVDNDGSGSALSFVQQVVFTSGDTVRPQIGASFWYSNFTNANVNLIDEWLISPRVADIEDGDSLYFYAGAIGGSFDDSLRVFISTTDSALGSFTNQIGYFRVDGPVGSWHAYGFDISSFAGDDIFVAVNYYIVDGGATGTHSDNVWIDHFLITTEGVTSVDEGSQPVPDRFVLRQNYPNPFNPTTQIEYELPVSAHVRVEVLNVLGEQIQVLDEGEREAGVQRVSFDASGLSAGVYFYRMTAGASVQTRKMILLK